MKTVVEVEEVERIVGKIRASGVAISPAASHLDRVLTWPVNPIWTCLLRMKESRYGYWLGMDVVEHFLVS